MLENDYEDVTFVKESYDNDHDIGKIFWLISFPPRRNLWSASEALRSKLKFVHVEKYVNGSWCYEINCSDHINSFRGIRLMNQQNLESLSGNMICPDSWMGLNPNQQLLPLLAH